MSFSTKSSCQQQARVRLINMSSPGLTSNNTTRMQPIRATVPYQLMRGASQSPPRSPSLCVGTASGAATLKAIQGSSSACSTQLLPGKGENGTVDPRPVVVHRLSPDSPSTSEWTTSVFCAVERSKVPTGSVSSAICRASSLDTVTGQYLNGQWPRESHALHPTSMKDKATQTPGFWNEDEGELITHRRSSSWGSADHLREIAKLRQQLHRSKQSNRQSKEKEQGAHPVLCPAQVKTLPVSSPSMTQSKYLISRVPSYVEGLNSELENVFINDDWEKKDIQSSDVQDGRRAPLPLLHHSNGDAHSTESQVSPCCGTSPWWSASPASLPDLQRSRPCSAEGYDRDSESSSPLPAFSTSPKPNNSFMFKREPPEGCERVKVFEDIVSSPGGFPLFSCPDRNKVNFVPTGSAFCPVKLLCSSLLSSYSASSRTPAASPPGAPNLQQSPAPPV